MLRHMTATSALHCCSSMNQLINQINHTPGTTQTDALTWSPQMVSLRMRCTFAVHSAVLPVR